MGKSGDLRGDSGLKNGKKGRRARGMEAHTSGVLMDPWSASTEQAVLCNRLPGCQCAAYPPRLPRLSCHLRRILHHNDVCAPGSSTAGILGGGEECTDVNHGVFMQKGMELIHNIGQGRRAV